MVMGSRGRGLGEAHLSSCEVKSLLGPENPLGLGENTCLSPKASPPQHFPWEWLYRDVDT